MGQLHWALAGAQCFSTKTKRMQKAMISEAARQSRSGTLPFDFTLCTCSSLTNPGSRSEQIAV